MFLSLTCKDSSWAGVKINLTKKVICSAKNPGRGGPKQMVALDKCRFGE